MSKRYTRAELNEMLMSLLLGIILDIREDADALREMGARDEDLVMEEANNKAEEFVRASVKFSKRLCRIEECFGIARVYFDRMSKLIDKCESFVHSYDAYLDKLVSLYPDGNRDEERMENIWKAKKILALFCVDGEKI